MTTHQISISSDESTPTTLDASSLATVQGGMIRLGGGGGSSTPDLHLGGFPQVHAAPHDQPPRCASWKTWNSPQGIGVLNGGGFAPVPLLSCPAIKKGPVPRPPFLFGH